jgi:hypothetical protein
MLKEKMTYKEVCDQDEYQYPFTVCRNCGADLTGDYDVDLYLSIGGRVTSVSTGLDEDGRLQDVDDALKNGYHSYAACAKCQEDLEDMLQDVLHELEDAEHG